MGDNVTLGNLKKNSTVYEIEYPYVNLCLKLCAGIQ